MSDSVLKLIPADPYFVPDAKAQSIAVDALEKLVRGERCEVEDYGHVTYIDQGENLESIHCPACGADLPLHDSPEADTNTEWYYTEIDDRASADFKGVSAEMPCCKQMVPLTTVKFDWPGGFARFELSIWNPEISNLSPQQLAEFESILGCKLLQVRAHY